MELIRFTEAEILAHASAAHEYFARRPAEKLFRIYMKVQRDFRVYHVSSPIIEIERPACHDASGLGEAVKEQAALWHIFNQIFEESTRLVSGGFR